MIDYLKEKKEQGELSDEQYEKFITEFTIQLLETIPKMKRMDYSHSYFFIEDINILSIISFYLEINFFTQRTYNYRYN